MAGARPDIARHDQVRTRTLAYCPGQPRTKHRCETKCSADTTRFKRSSLARRMRRRPADPTKSEMTFCPCPHNVLLPDYTCLQGGSFSDPPAALRGDYDDFRQCGPV